MTKHHYAYSKISFLPVYKNKCNFCHLLFVLVWFVWHILKGFCGFPFHVLFWQFLRVSTLQSATLRNSPELIRLLCSFRKFSDAYTMVQIQPLYREIREVFCQAHAILANTHYLVVYCLSVIRVFDCSGSFVSHTKVNRAVLPLFPGQPILWGTCQHYQWDSPY